MSWREAAMRNASQHPTVLGLRCKAYWHRKQSENFLVHSVQAMHQHEKDADHHEATATSLEMEMVAKAGVTAGEWKCYLTGFSKEIGRYIQVQTSQGWSPDYFWCQHPQKAASATLS